MKRGIITVESEAMRDVVHNLGIHSGIISPTSLAGVLLMPSQAHMHRINSSKLERQHCQCACVDTVKMEVSI